MKVARFPFDYSSVNTSDGLTEIMGQIGRIYGSFVSVAQFPVNLSHPRVPGCHLGEIEEFGESGEFGENFGSLGH